MLVAYSVNARLGVKERLIHIYVSYHAVNVLCLSHSLNRVPTMTLFWRGPQAEAAYLA